MINLHERMLPTSAGVEPATSWSPVGRASEPPRPAELVLALLNKHCITGKYKDKIDKKFAKMAMLGLLIVQKLLTFFQQKISEYLRISRCKF